MNKVFLIGSLTRDPELMETSKGVSFCRFAIAVDRDYIASDDTKKTDFFNVTAYKGTAAAISQYVRKGDKIAIEGEINIDSFVDSVGTKRLGTNIIVKSAEFLRKKANNSLDNDE